MKNVKLTLATAFSILALSFTGLASADHGNYNKKTHETVSKNKKITKKVVVKKAPVKKVVAVKKVAVKKKPAKVTKSTVYSVRSGDTLTKISYKTGVSVTQLAKLNHIKQKNLNNLFVGQVLKLL